MLAAVVCGAALVLSGPDPMFVTALSILVGASIAWVLVSVLWPARPDRTCPACGKEELLRMDPGSTRGVACASCGHRDAEQSSFLLAEDDGASLETIRLEERSRRKVEAR
jgi:hypothetical protein